ncbi:MAG: fatty acid--CoA ligase family protein, partial [Sphingomonadales bacterium]
KAVLVGEGQNLPKDSFRAPIFGLAKEKNSNVDFTLNDKDFGLILFTSGTTGNPKGVVHTKSSIEAKISLNLESFGKAVFERSLCVLSSHFVAGLFSNILTPLAAGGEVFLFPDPGVKGTSMIGELIDANRITMINTVPSLWNIILKSSSPPKGSSLKFISIVSAPLEPKTKEGIVSWVGTDKVHNLYGTTETGGWNTGLSGTVLGGQAALLDGKGEVNQAGTGELLIKTSACMSGYFHRPDLTEEAFKEGWFKTGDLANIDKEGLITIVGRVKTQINRAGIKIIPEEVEALLLQYPEVSGACVFAYPDEITGEGVAAVLELETDKNIDFSSLRIWCKSRIRAVSIPERWFKVNALPRTQSGKIDRREITTRFSEKKEF